MSLTPRDRKIVLILLPLLLLAGYWFLVLTPKREESTKVTEELTKARTERDTAQAQVGQLNAAKASFASDYQTVIRMGKAIPEAVDMPSLLVQLDRAARGTGVDIQDLKVTNPNKAAAAAPPPAPNGGAGPGAGGTGAQSPQGQAAQGAGNAVNDANARAQQGADAGGAAGATPTPSQAPGLQSVGLQYKLAGDFFDMADFFHRMKRFVLVANEQLVIRGRLLTIDKWAFVVDPEHGGIKADVTATVYLSPKAQGGVDAGASPTGPSPAPAGGNVAADPASSSPPTAAAPTP
jgi:hypothetical protein